MSSIVRLVYTALTSTHSCWVLLEQYCNPFGVCWGSVNHNGDCFLTTAFSRLQNIHSILVLFSRKKNEIDLPEMQICI